MADSIQLPRPEHLRVEKAALQPDAVKLVVGHEAIFLVLEIEDAPNEQGATGEEDVVQLVDPRLV